MVSSIISLITRKQNQHNPPNPAGLNNNIHTLIEIIQTLLPTRLAVKFLPFSDLQPLQWLLPFTPRPGETEPSYPSGSGRGPGCCCRAQRLLLYVRPLDWPESVGAHAMADSRRTRNEGKRCAEGLHPGGNNSDCRIQLRWCTVSRGYIRMNV